MPLAQVNRHTLRVGDNLHIGLPTIELPISVAPFLPGQIYSYNLTLTPDDGTPQQTFASLGLLQDRAGVEQNEQLTVKPHLALGYGSGMLPSFALPPSQLTDLKVLHGSCRRPHANTPDAMTFIDDIIGDTRTDGLKRPHQLFLTGDQIYADDVATTLLDMLTPAGNELIGSVEHLPRAGRSNRPSPAVRLWPADRAHFPAGLRKNVVLKDARFSTKDYESHLLSFGEFCAMYLFCWSNVLWPQTLAAHGGRLQGARPARPRDGHLALARRHRRADQAQARRVHPGQLRQPRQLVSRPPQGHQASSATACPKCAARWPTSPRT